MIYLNINQQQCSKKEFINQWAKEYYKFTPISDTVFYYCEDKLRNIENKGYIVDIVGAWKEGCLGLNDYNTGLSFKCPNCNNTYFFNNRWREDCPIAYNGWKYIGDNINDIITQLENNSEILFNELSSKRFDGFNNKKEKIKKLFGPIFTSTMFNFLKPDRYAILDRFAFKSLQYLNNNLLDKNIEKYNFNQYQRYSSAFFNLRYDNNITSKTTREIDKALFSFGHFLKNKNNLKKNVRKICSNNCYV